MAGLELMIGITASLFLIGMLVFAYTLAGTKIADQTTDATAKATINETVIAISGVTDWFGLYIVIGSVVVIILMIVLIIRAVQSSGAMGGNGGA